MDEVEVGICEEHGWIHVRETYYYDVGDYHCVNFAPIPNFKHECSEIGNSFGSYDCTCGEPWLDSGCMTGADRE